MGGLSKPFKPSLPMPLLFKYFSTNLYLMCLYTYAYEPGMRWPKAGMPGCSKLLLSVTSVCVCMCVYVIYVCVCVCVCVLCACVCVCVCMCMCICVCVCVYVYMCMCVLCVYVCMSVSPTQAIKS